MSEDTKTEEQKRAEWEEAAQRQAAHEYEAFLKDQEQIRNIREAQRWAQRTQHEINNAPRRRYAAIVAVDERGGFAKDGKIPWHYPSDFTWFQNQTKGHICVMGRATYDDLVNHLGDKGAASILPDRECYVVTSTPLPTNNATAIASIRDLDKHLPVDDVSKTVFFIGGERIYSEGIALADTVYITIVNKDVDADRFFPTKYVLKHFNVEKVFKVDNEPDLRFTIWKRKPPMRTS